MPEIAATRGSHVHLKRLWERRVAAMNVAKPLARETLKKSIHGFFQVVSSRHMSAMASANQRLMSLFALGPLASNGKR
jgi:hypothetical protein